MNMDVPDYYFMDNQKPFEVLTDLNDDVVKAILSDDTQAFECHLTF